MGQKVHPLGFRLGITQKHLSNWFAFRKNYSKYLFEDRFLRQKLYEYYGKATLSKIEIHRKIDNHFELTLHVNKDDIWAMVGSKSQKQKVKKRVLQILQEYRKSSFFQTYFFTSISHPTSHAILLALNVQPCSNVSAALIGEFLVHLLERRIPYRKARNLLFRYRKEVSNLKGFKIQISGRLNGAEIARSEWIREARLPLQTLHADIDYSSSQAHTIYGVLGIKIWVLK